MKKRNANHELQRKDFPTVYHYRAAVRAQVIPAILSRWGIGESSPSMLAQGLAK